MGDTTDFTEPKGDSSTQGVGEVDPYKRLPSFKPPRDFTLTKPDSEDSKKKRKSSQGRSSKKSKAEKKKDLPTKAKSSGASSEGLRRSGRNASSTSTSAKAQKIDEDEEKPKSAVIEIPSDEEKTMEEDLSGIELPVDDQELSEQEQKTDGDEEKKDANVGDEIEKGDAREEIIQEQLAEMLQPMEDAVGIAPNTEPQPEEKKGEADNTQVLNAGEEDRNNEPEKKSQGNTVATQTLD